MPYEAALALLEALSSRPREAEDVLIALEHPPTFTVGRRGGADLFRLTPGAGDDAPAVHHIARGGSVTWHGPGQLVIYPVVHIASLAGPVGRGPLGDLPALVRLLELALKETCATFGLATEQRPGFSGLWVDARRKLASIGLGVRGGWTTHGLALNVDNRLDGFAAIVPCGLDFVEMTTLAAELTRANKPAPALDEVESVLLAHIDALLRRRGAGDDAGK